MASYDGVIVGSGINSLAAAALLARGGWSVCVLEAKDELGGAVKTAELTEPGFVHDLFSAWHPLWVGGAAHALLGEELSQRGLEYLNTEHPTGTVYPDGEAAFLTRSTDGTAAELDRHGNGDGDAWRHTVADFMPNVPRGGGARLVQALAQLIRDHGGELQTGRDVDHVLVSAGRATAIQTTDGERVDARRAVLCNVTPRQLYGRLLRATDIPRHIADGARRFRSGRSEMQIHFALSEPPRWAGDERLGKTALLHLTPGLDGISRAVNEAERGFLPAEPTVVVGQPTTVDPSRAPPGRSVLWIQLQELPWDVKGDAAGEIDTKDGRWTEELRERYADRIQARIGHHVTNLERAILKRVTLSPADLQAANPNLERGDPYGGALALDQNFLWRPFPAQPGHRTAVDSLFHIGASTWPGPGLGAGSGTLVAQDLLRPAAPLRALTRVKHALSGR